MARSSRFDSHDGLAAFPAEPCQKPAGSASEVQDARPLRNQIDDGVVVQSATMEDAGGILAAQIVDGRSVVFDAAESPSSSLARNARIISP